MMKKSAPPTTDPEFDKAKERGNRAKNLFPDANKDIMKKIVKALKQEDLHAAHPDVEDSGKSDFFEACRGNVGLTAGSAEEAVFISDLWNTALAARRAQEQRPCW